MKSGCRWTLILRVVAIQRCFKMGYSRLGHYIHTIALICTSCNIFLYTRFQSYPTLGCFAGRYGSPQIFLVVFLQIRLPGISITHSSQWNCSIPIQDLHPSNASFCSTETKDASGVSFTAASTPEFIENSPVHRLTQNYTFYLYSYDLTGHFWARQHFNSIAAQRSCPHRRHLVCVQ